MKIFRFKLFENYGHEEKGNFLLLFKVFAEWNKGALDSYLIEITSHILKFKDEKNQTLLPSIRDAAGQVFQFEIFEDNFACKIISFIPFLVE